MKTHEIKTFRKTYKQYIKPCVFEGYKLAVLFDEKDTVKSLGARWNSDEQTWWIPKGMLNQNVTSGFGTIHEYLNDSSMIIGQYGGQADAGYIEQNGTPKMYTLRSESGQHMTIAWYVEYDAVRFGRAGESDEWKNIEEGRKFWDSLIQDGYSRMVETCRQV
jgi:hypothetical protein